MFRRRFSAKTNNKLRCNPHTSEPGINDAMQKGYFQQVSFTKVRSNIFTLEVVLFFNLTIKPNRANIFPHFVALFLP